MSQPKPGTGTVFVNRWRDGTYAAIWQGDDTDHVSHIDIEGSRSEILAWIATCSPANFLAFDPPLDDYVPFTMSDGEPVDFPL